MPSDIDNAVFRTGLALGPELKAIRRLPAFFPQIEQIVTRRRFGDEPDLVLSWNACAVAYPAATRLRVGDGLIRSVSPAAAGAPPVSLIYEIGEGAEPKRLRAILDDTVRLADPALMAEAEDLMNFKRSQRLGRTNPAATFDPKPSLRGRRRVLVVDGSPLDRCLGIGGTSADVFSTMIRAARADNPGAAILVLRQAGSAACLSAAALAEADLVIDDADTVSLLEQVDVVYTVDSLVGMEALLIGRPVVCFGAPFYCGRGLTDDRTQQAQHAQLSVEALFAGLYLLYPRYIDPLAGEPCPPRVAFERLAAFKRHADRVAGRWAGVNLPLAKHHVVRAFFSGPRSSFSSALPRDIAPDTLLLAWASKPNASVRALQSSHADRLAYIEDGFLRSVGLGSSFVPASSLALDRSGIYYDPARPSDLEAMLRDKSFSASELDAARRLRELIVAARLSKYNLAGAAPLSWPDVGARRRILVPGQVENDASVTTGGGGLSNADLLEQVRVAAPDAWIVYKEHPDVTAGNRKGRLPASAAGLADLTLDTADIADCLDAVDEVHTLTSLTGFEALLRGLPVTTYGWPFYAGWGLTRDLSAAPAPPRRALSLDALVAGALIAYPLYLDPRTWLPCDALTFVARLADLSAELEAAGKVSRAGRVGRVAQAMRTILSPPRLTAY